MLFEKEIKIGKPMLKRKRRKITRGRSTVFEEDFQKEMWARKYLQDVYMSQYNIGIIGSRRTHSVEGSFHGFPEDCYNDVQDIKWGDIQQGESFYGDFNFHNQATVKWVAITEKFFWLSESCVLTCGNIKKCQEKNYFYELNFCKGLPPF